ncbi:cobaltochelatase subunit CobN [Sphingomonas sp. NY01]|uniref:cobaltochelatase subunit CobN n=1 Tax=Sphingomonas sp. NY01 TaxID=2968057 RepID=UPI00315C658C
MHLVFRESHGLEEGAVPRDLGQSPGDLLVLSFSDSDLRAFAAGWQGAGRASLRLANLEQLAHPLSVDTYVERTAVHAKAILIRLIGGPSYWSYGLSQMERIARDHGIALAVLPADGREDVRLDKASTLPVPLLRTLAGLCEQGGPTAAGQALDLLAQAANLPFVLSEVEAQAPPPIPPVGAWNPTCPAAFALTAKAPIVLILFYRAYRVADDMAPIAALRSALEDRGFAVLPLYLPSLKAEEAQGWLHRWIAHLAPAAILNATAFSAPLDTGGAPIFQVALATSTHAAWADAPRGLSPADLAMHIVLPEVDGRLFVGVASFKEDAPHDPALDFAPRRHRPDPERVPAIAARVAAHVRLGQTPATRRRTAIILSTYPGKAHQMAHAVGLDAIASTHAILEDIGAPPAPDLAQALATRTIRWPLADYRAALATLPPALRDDLFASWGEPAGDAFHFPAIAHGNTLIALQPERGRPDTRADDYHDLSRCPSHAYVAFYLWLHARGTDAVIHVGAHGTLEWLPGKAVALSGACWPDALVRDLPVLYPFIVNDPGEAAQAKRRIGAVTLGHAPPPLVRSGTGAGLARLEALLDEFASADGLDPARRDRLRTDITDEAAAAGLAMGTDIASIDAFVCDVKDSQYGDGLHVYGRGPQGQAERAGLLAGLAGAHVPPGPAGSPHRGRSDVLPTGRNLYTIDPRATPSRAAHQQGIRLADELVRRHLQDEGDWLRTLVVDLWGSATMRTAGEEFAMALHLLGVEPVWDHRSTRVTGFEILPLARLDRPRIDVTLRVSGLFRDAFPTLIQLFGQAVRALALRDEPVDRNPFTAREATPRVYGPAPGRYGIGLGDLGETYTPQARAAAGHAWLAASAHALDAGDAHDPAGIAARVETAQGFVHVQDLPETDLLLAADYAAHEAGFAAARALTGGSAALYHLDARDPERIRARTLPQEIARVVHARAAHPGWIAGMMRHGFRGAAEIAATLDHLGAFSHLADAVAPELFDRYYEATLADPQVCAFLAAANPQALAAMEARFAALHAAGLWRTRRNSIAAALDTGL